MRQIGRIENETSAHRFGDYLLSAGVKNSVEEGAGGWDVWVEDDDHLDAARAELEKYRQDQSNPRYDRAPKVAESLREAELKNQQRRRRKFIDVRTQWGTPAQWNTPVTLMLIALSLGVGLTTQMGEDFDGPAMHWLRFVTASPPLYRYNLLQDLKTGQVWRLITPIFIHHGPLHLLFNMFWLFDLGRQIEMRRGSLFLLALVLFSAVAGNFAQYYWSGPFFGGMSGVVYALFGYVWMKGRYQPHLGMGVRQETVLVMIGWLALCMTGWVGPIGNAAHVIGLIVGMAFGYLPYKLRRMTR